MIKKRKIKNKMKNKKKKGIKKYVWYNGKGYELKEEKKKKKHWEN
jgi:hypothetical protein